MKLRLFLSIFLFTVFFSCKKDISLQKKSDLNNQIKSFDSIAANDRAKAKFISDGAFDEIKRDTSAILQLKAYYYKTRLEIIEGNVEQTGTYAQQALDIAKKLKEERLVNQLYIILGNYYVQKNEYSKAAAVYLKAQNYFEQNNDSENLSALYNAMGIFYFETGDLQNSRNYFDKTYFIYNQKGNVRGKGLYYANVGNIYMITEDYLKALEYQERALKNFEKIKDSVSMASCMINISNIESNLKNYDKALAVLNDAWNMAEKGNNSRLKERILLNYSIIYSSKGNLDKAYDYTERHIAYAKELDYPKGVMNGYDQMAGVLNKKGDFKNTATYLKRYYELKDSIYGSEVKQRIEELKWSNEFEKSKMESELLKSKYDIEKERSTSLLFLSLLVIFTSILVIGLGWLLYRNKKKSLKLIEIDNERLHEKIELERVKTEKEKAENDLLKVKADRQLLELESKNREITSISLQLVAKNKIMSQISKVIDKKKKSTEEIEAELKSILFQNQNQEKDWEQFKEVFENIHPGFYENLKERYPQLTATDCRICAYIRIRMSLNEVAGLMNISLQSLHTSRYRIRKKLELDSDVNLDDFILNFEL
ncbi:tetratricopeptide repeat protein [Flavobacterium rakeshii]|uniref:Tetratricopeptide repeat protein n=1 Tax=Flavobacterium rakeshii TaxID=1038845 RepID=A0A6N8HFQ4_9FLAO|nr:tetratricopeptide repeat protein [Flavobacterium rakeshii]MUV04549.1 tetratricopeptide repeat protein [Flavobacterium rakeshii]